MDEKQTCKTDFPQITAGACRSAEFRQLTRFPMERSEPLPLAKAGLAVSLNANTPGPCDRVPRSLFPCRFVKVKA